MSSRDLRRQMAVALRYEIGGMPAPQVTAKGWGDVAQRIEETARAHNVPVRQDPDLAQVLIQLDLGSYIPEELYGAVVEVLSFVYRLNGRP